MLLVLSLLAEASFFLVLAPARNGITAAVRGPLLAAAAAEENRQLSATENFRAPEPKKLVTGQPEKLLAEKIRFPIAERSGYGRRPKVHPAQNHAALALG